MQESWMDENQTLFLWIAFGASFLFLCGMISLPRWIAWWIGWAASDAKQVISDHRDQAPEGPETARGDNLRRLLDARQVLDPLLDAENRDLVDGKLHALQAERSEVQAQVQGLFDLGMTLDDFRARGTMTLDQLATVEAWIASGEVMPPRAR